MQLEIITPESKVFSGEAEAVQFPGLDGCFQVLNDHSAIISALTKGEVKVNLTSILEQADDSIEFIKTDKSDNKVIRIDIKGGVMEMLNNKVIVLAE